ncbi:hypothetical protein TSOC_007263 [Tetrabaena socialis]|uniref:Uncharacterized protein n=1 Tax=Tetrabaena socialis TaxID=47790 RepID=A0A2J8A1F6_9CHLO|nr:hypothetical protein TSOC_007263 [Tetrabaena socialis]|eukprot:PNH06356.1 hypothetical protein TSOC_007263 [Tetrabaena socialis]
MAVPRPLVARGIERPRAAAQHRVAVAVLVKREQPRDRLLAKSAFNDVLELTNKLPRAKQTAVLSAFAKVAEEKDEATRQLLEEKDKTEKDVRQLMEEGMRSLKQVHQLEKMLVAAMRSAGVVDARSFLEHIKLSEGLGDVSHVQAWKILLNRKPKLAQCLTTQIPSWAIRDKKSAPDVLASNIASLHRDLNNTLHSFDIPNGLVIYPNVPNQVAVRALQCIAENFNVPHVVVKIPTARQLEAVSPGASADDCTAEGACNEAGEMGG